MNRGKKTLFFVLSECCIWQRSDVKGLASLPQEAVERLMSALVN